MTIEQLLSRWELTVELLEQHNYINDISDFDELIRDISWREEFLSKQLNAQQRQKLLELDDRFRAALASALRKANFVQLYKQWGTDKPTDHWWWHCNFNTKKKE